MKLMNTPKKIDLDITSRCNLRCSYCYYFSSDGDTGVDLPLEQWLQFFEECNRCAVTEVCLCGGEPLIREDFKEFVEGVVKNRMRFSVLSNGTLINDDIVEFLKSTKRCNSFQVSIDGPGPESHDACRGKGSFEKALRGLRILMNHKMPATVRVTIHKHNVRQLDEIAKLLLEDVGLPSFSTNSASHAGLCRQNEADVQLGVEDYSYAMEKLLELNKKYSNRIGAQAGPLASVKHWLEIEDAIKNGVESLPNCGYLRSCGGVFANLAVRSDGTLVPCSQINHTELGKINEVDLKDIWQNHPELKSLRARRDMTLDVFDYCKECKFIPYCRGGCPAMAYNLAGNENVPSPDACYKRFLEMGGKLPK
jgi:SynChlorMet cassette radical SAM/SPASM protein ScmE